ncbi:MAG: helix-turn-helix domain-containing protein [Bacilli bacterium]
MAEMTYGIIGERIKKARSNSGFTQQQIADYIGIKRESISYFENGQREIDMLTLQKISDLCGYSMSYFVSPENVSDVPQVSAAFRTQDLSTDDLEVLAWAKRFAKNLSSINKILSK